MTDESTVKTLFDAAGLSPTEDEMTYFVTTYPLLRGMADMLYTVDAARYDDPCLNFDPAPEFADWG